MDWIPLLDSVAESLARCRVSTCDIKSFVKHEKYVQIEIALNFEKILFEDWGRVSKSRSSRVQLFMIYIGEQFEYHN